MNSLNPHSTRDAGWSLLELSVAITLLALGILSNVGVALGTFRLAEDGRESAMAAVAARNAIEMLRNAPFDSLTTDFGPGSGKESFYFVEDASIVFTDPGNAWARGQVEFFMDEAGVPEEFGGLELLRSAQEVITSILPVPGFGGVDLNSDGDTADTTPSDYRIVPMRMTLDIAGKTPKTEILYLILHEARSW